MGGQSIIERIISDAENEAASIIKAAEERAARTVAEAGEQAKRHMLGTQAEAREKAKAIADGKAASARLDAAKILLGEKRGVIDEIYARALNGLLALGKAETLHLAARLISEYAEEGDEVAFAQNFRFAQEVASLPQFREKNLKISAKRADADGGFVLYGKISDKNVSYGALLAADREERQAELAAEIFND